MCQPAASMGSLRIVQAKKKKKKKKKSLTWPLLEAPKGHLLVILHTS